MIKRHSFTKHAPKIKKGKLIRYSPSKNPIAVWVEDK